MKLKITLLTLFIVMLTGAPIARAEEVDPSVTASVELEATSTESATPVETKPVEYNLPYPGLLPDHSFYFFKTMRDKIMSILISNPVKKAEFNRLQADKRVQAAYLLVMKGKEKHVLAEETLSKGLNYFEESVSKVKQAKTEGLDIHDATLKLSLANMKHMEIIKEIQAKVGKEEAKKFERGRVRIIELDKRVKELRP